MAKLGHVYRLCRLSCLTGSLIAAIEPGPARAHGGLTGTTDLLVDYGLFAIIGILAILGAAVSSWLSAEPTQEFEESEDEPSEVEEMAEDDTSLPSTEPSPDSLCSVPADQLHQARPK